MRRGRACRRGRADEALEDLEEALAATRANAERWREAELFRLRGDLLLAVTETAHDEAEGCYTRALEIARDKRAKSLELRTAMSLARLRLRQDRSAEGRDLLGPLHDWFTEGLDTSDLNDARTLLEELGG